MKQIKILLIMLAMVGLSGVLMAQIVIYVEPNSIHRVMCWSDGDGTQHLSLDEDCDINLNGNEDGNNQDTLKLPIGTTCEVEAGSEGDYYSYDWMGIWDTYTKTIDNEGSWFVSKLSNVTGYTYVGHFWVKFYDPNSVVDVIDVDISFYPNPVTDFLIIEYDRDIQWELISITGQLLMKGSEKRVDVSKLPSGCYLIQIETDDGVLTKKILK